MIAVNDRAYRCRVGPGPMASLSRRRLAKRQIGRLPDKVPGGRCRTLMSSKRVEKRQSTPEGADSDAFDKGISAYLVS
jgi:hypothetical protein